MYEYEPGSPLAELEQRLKLTRDRVRGVASKQHTGFYLHGRPGTSKTYTVRNTLEEMGVRYGYVSGHITEMGLFETLSDYHDSVIILDDVSQLFRQKIGMQFLLAALGNQDGKPRIISYRMKGQLSSIKFTGGIIAISNLELNDANGTVAALKSRVNHLQYDPSDLQLEALMIEICKSGWKTMTPDECSNVAQFLIAESKARSVRLDMRNLVDKAYPDYLQWSTGMSEAHWKDLIRSTLHERLIGLMHTPEIESRASIAKREWILARSIDKNLPDRASKTAHWIEKTGKSEAQYYRRLRESKQ